MAHYLFLAVPKRDFGSHPCRVVSSSYQIMVLCHGRGREFESRRPRHIFNSSFPCPEGLSEGSKDSQRDHLRRTV